MSILHTHTRTRAHTHTHTHTTVLWPFVRDYPGRPVPEETFTHSHPSWSSDILYQLLPSTTICSILFVQFTCLTVLFQNLSPCSLWSSSWSWTLYFTHAHTIAACFAVIPMLCHLFLISLSISLSLCSLLGNLSFSLLLDTTDWKYHMSCQFVPFPVTLDDLEGRSFAICMTLSSAIWQTFVQHFARLQLTWRVMRSLSDSRASYCTYNAVTFIGNAAACNQGPKVR